VCSRFPSESHLQREAPARRESTQQKAGHGLRSECRPTAASAAHSSANGWRMIVLHFSGALRRGSLR
jgi:hypothetical protein